MVRLIGLLFIIFVLYLYANKEQSIDEPYGFTPSIITVEELPPIKEENK